MSAVLEDMQHEGSTVLRQAVASGRVLDAREACATKWREFRKSATPWFGGGGLIGHINYYPPPDTDLLVSILLDPAIAAAVRSVLGPDCSLRGHAGNVNMPGSRHQPDHVDGRLGNQFLLLNVPLGDADESNGAIEIYPGTHRSRRSISAFLQYRRTHRPRRVSTRCGDVILRYPNVWHRGTPNRSGNPRFMLGLMYGPPDADQAPFVVRPELVDVLANAPIPVKVVGGESKVGHFAPNYFSPNVAGWAKELLWCYARPIYDLTRAVQKRHVLPLVPETVAHAGGHL